MRLDRWRQGLIFGCVAVIGMMLPLRMETGVIFDGRSVILSLAAWYFGWQAALVSAPLAMGYHIYLGGPGVEPGLLVILASCFLGLLFRMRVKPESRPPSILETLGLGLGVHIVMLLILSRFLPEDSAGILLRQMMLPILILYPLTTLLAARILTGQINRYGQVRRLKESETRFRTLFENSQLTMLNNQELLDSMVVDVSGIRSSERKLRIALAQRNTILATAMNGFWVTDGDGHILEVNGAYCQMSGYTEAELLQMRVADLDADATEDDFHNTQQEILEGKSRRMERRHRAKDGSLLLVEVSTSSLEGPDGLLFFSFFRDISRERARESQMRLHSAMLQATANTVVITDPAGCIEWANAAFTRTTGYALEEAIGHSPGKLLKSGAHPPDFYTQMWDTIRKGGIWSGEIVNRKKDGSHYEEQMTITPLMEENGRIHHYIAIKQDISEQKNLERMLLRVQRVESMGQLSSGIAHDLNNILSPILMSADLLKTELPPGPRLDMVEIIAESAKRGADVLRQLLAYARGTQGEKLDLMLVPLLREGIRMFKETFPREIRIEDSIPRDLWNIHADPTQIHQLFSNLLLNARDAMPEGGLLQVKGGNVDLAPEWTAQHPPARPGSFVKISVIDSGQGMTAEIQDKIFDPFFTTKSAGKGSGIGLSTVMGILKGHGGFVLVNSQHGKGSRFDVYLPSRGPARPVNPLEKPVKRTGMTLGQGERIVVVDDEASVGMMLQNSLKSLGYHSEIYNSGRQALERLGQEPAVNLLLLDYMMPDMNGAAVLKEIDRRGLKIPTLIISGMLPENMMQDGQVLGRPILYKPFSIHELSERIREMLPGK